MNLKPIIILGAPRSGTNMLRDILCQHKSLVTWPCDEINPIWKYGNYNHTDELKSYHLTERIDNFIKNQFYEIRNSSLKIVVEKTCANTLRPEFIYNIFPDAKFIFIYRNGYDCAISAKKKKIKQFDFNYQFRKLKYAPIQSIPTLISEKFVSKIWGPNYNGMLNDLKYLNNIEISSKQWMKCNRSVLNFIKEFPNANIKLINYEKLVSNPTLLLKEILDFLSPDVDANFKFQTEHIFKSSIGNSMRELTSEERESISIFIDETNELLNLN